jgi:exodeoxyribonuclease VII large subunit
VTARRRTNEDDEPPLVWELPGAPASPSDAQGAAPPDEPADATLSVPQVAARLKAILEREFPEPFWLAGEVSGLSRGGRGASGHWYFKLVDDQPEDAGRRASLDVILWRTQVARLFGPRGKLAGVLVPEDGIVLRVRVKPDWYAPGGRLSFVIDDVDPDFTLGNLDRQRRELVARLEAEGATRRNKEVSLADVPLRLGLITAEGSAAWNDVLHTLQASGIGFRVACCDARMQGEATGQAVCAALATLAAARPDAILLVRGGGSRLDLSWFDREDIARAVAYCPVPVLTGIGHEIDTSVADLVAHRAFKTPTAVAEFLAERAREARRQVEDAWAGIVEHAGQALAGEQDGLLDTARRLRLSALGALDAGAAALRETSQRLRATCEAGLAAAGEALAELRVRLVHGRHMERLAGLRVRLDGDVARLTAGARARLDAEAALLERAAERARLLDPRGVLARGFAWLRRPDGRLVKDARALSPGETLTAVLRDGELDARVLDVRPQPEPYAPAPPT